MSVKKDSCKESDIVWEWEVGKFGYYCVKEKHIYRLYANGITHATRIANCSYSDIDRVYAYLSSVVERKQSI